VESHEVNILNINIHKFKCIFPQHLFKYLAVRMLEHAVRVEGSTQEPLSPTLLLPVQMRTTGSGGVPNPIKIKKRID
jgi:hypothetical protein